MKLCNLCFSLAKAEVEMCKQEEFEGSQNPIALSVNSPSQTLDKLAKR